MTEKIFRENFHERLWNREISRRLLHGAHAWGKFDEGQRKRNQKERKRKHDRKYKTSRKRGMWPSSVSREQRGRGELQLTSLWTPQGALQIQKRMATDGQLTGSQILPDVQRAQYAVRYVEVREHLQLDDLIGDVQERLGIHCECD